MSRSAIAFAALALMLPTLARADEKARPTPVVDVVLCLDVSGSMNNLLESAKAKLWDLVNELGTVRPTPQLRVGLYSYGHSDYDAAKGWVRKEVELTTDLDTIYKKLNALRIASRSSPEYVARACQAALVEQKWSADKKALRMIFVCGNEPADQDKEVTLEAVAKLALEKDVIVNTIHCKWSSVAAGEVEGWQNLAKRAEGRFAQIDMKQAPVVVATPQDKEIEALGKKLNTTYVAYGQKESREAKAENQVAQDGLAARAGAAASRSVSKATGLYRNADWDLVDRLKDDPKFDVTKVPEAELCDELKKMKPEERVAHLKKKLAEREAIQKEISELNQRRVLYLKEAAKKSAKIGDKAFDDAVRGALREQAKKKGFVIPD